MTALPHERRGHLTAVPNIDADTTPAGNLAVGRFEWESWIRRINMPIANRALAMTLSTYASRDGSSVRPGNERLARVLRCSTRTIQRNRQYLVNLGLLERTYAARRAGHADVYRLTIPPTITDWPDLLNPDEE